MWKCFTVFHGKNELRQTNFVLQQEKHQLRENFNYKTKLVKCANLVC